MEDSHWRGSLRPVWPGEALVAGSLARGPISLYKPTCRRVLLLSLGFCRPAKFQKRRTAAVDHNRRCDRTPSLRASAKQSRATTPNTSSQAAARLVGSERGAFFGGGRSRSAGILKQARNL